jgi:16S rRNA (guanine527-N7)-methyltransferase
MASPGDPGVGRPVSFAALERAIHEAGLKNLPEQALEKFENYMALLIKWNSKLNLTAVREPEAIIRRHFVECIQCAQALPDSSGQPTVLDFGSGAGLPGIPIAICRPELRVTLGESQKKKVAFLREADRSLDLEVEVFDGRVEEMAPERLFSIVTLRAVDKMAGACRVALSRLAPEGEIILFATEGTEGALKAALPEVSWQELLPVTGQAGRILVGRRVRAE